MSYNIIAAITVSYVTLLFLVGYFAERSGWSQAPVLRRWIYALSFAVYCTAWTFYGSIGRAAEAGIAYLPVYLGPALLAPLWLYFLRKIIVIRHHLRVTSTADFLSSRYGRSTGVGVLVTLVCLAVSIPYISIQLKAIEFSIALVHGDPVISSTASVFYKDPILLASILIGAFVIVFGTLRVDATERHRGVMAVIAIESIVKLFCFLLGAGAVIWVMYDGLEDVFAQGAAVIDYSQYFRLGGTVSYGEWWVVMLLSAAAFIVLPRQFHAIVVENESPEDLRLASWVMPLYLLVISMLVIPVAIAGRLVYDSGVEPDTFLLRLLSSADWSILTILVFIGGISAIAGMMVVTVIALTTMISNNILLPLILRVQRQYTYFLVDLDLRVLALRRLLVVVVLLLSYGFYYQFSINYSIVSVGLISFAGIWQLVPSMVAALYWREANATGAIIGISLGAITWAYTLPFANLLELGYFTTYAELLDGSLDWLRPTSLFGLAGMSPVEHSFFWSTLFNVMGLSIGTRLRPARPQELAQADIFIRPSQYIHLDRTRQPLMPRSADVDQLRTVLQKVLSADKLAEIFKDHQMAVQAGPDLLDRVEKYLAGSLGAASARIILRNMVREVPTESSDIIALLDETRQLHLQRQQLSEQSLALAAANARLKELDQLKSEFISNVTHELRTPITSIRSFADILSSYDLSAEERQQFISIIKQESERVTQLVNQVLDLRKVEVQETGHVERFSLHTFLSSIVAAQRGLAGARRIVVQVEPHHEVSTDSGRLRQVVVNLLNNAIKFTDEVDGTIHISASLQGDRTMIVIRDNGIGIPPESVELVTERFFQVATSTSKHKGSGLGLSISKSLMIALGGSLRIDSKYGAYTAVEITLPTVAG